MKIPLSPMPKELQVLMQTRRGNCCYKWMIMLLYGSFIETRHVVAMKMEMFLQENKPVQTCVEIIKTYSLQPLQTRGTILSMQMNVLVLSMKIIHWITNHYCMSLTNVKQLTFNDNEH